MYSLYRAWFGGEDAYPRLETLSPPDTLVRVGNEGEHQFVAHRGVLAAHSGYLKALLATATNSTSTSGRDEATSPVTSVSVSSVGGEAFAPLLNYMYTGRLDVTLDNIYSVLLATHLLHMPGALEQCRAALLRLRGPPPPLPEPSATRPGTVLRPVPNRLVGPPLCWSQPGLYTSAPVGIPHLPNLQLPQSLSMLPGSMLQEQQQPAASMIPYSFRDNSPSPPPAILELRRQQQEVRSSPEVSVAACRAKVEREKPREPEEEVDKKEADRISIVDSVPSPLEGNERTSFSGNDQSAHRRSAGSSKSSNDPAAPAGTSITGVVYDVACCDGPVRFHRVLNENYVSTTTTTTTTTTAMTATVMAQQQRRTLPPEDDLDVSGSGENDENGKPEGNSSNETRASGASNATGSYTCGYCRHTFKSHYCYRKHARRHLLPTVDADGATNNNVNNNANRPDGRRREVRLLDLNVQYYPCKICGSKFPSYYFVHKHRKLCHANVEDRNTSGDGESSNVVQGANNSEDQ